MVKCPHCHHNVHVSNDTAESTQGHCHHKDHNRHEQKKEDANPLKFLSGLLLISGAVVALPCLALTMAGFGTAGIVAGSVAAATQSAIGNVAAGSAFAIAQSAGATGALVAGTTAGLTAGAAGAVGAVVEHHVDKKPEQHSDNDGNENKGPRTTMRCNHCGHEFTVSQ